MTGRQHSIVPHKTNYFFIPLEDDYLAMYEDLAQLLDPIKDANKEKMSGPSDCKGMIASVLEAWMNSKRPTAKCDDDLYVYLTYDEWEQALRYRYKRSSIIQCLKEMEVEGEYLDETGKHGKPMALYKGTVKKRHFVQNTFEYQLNLPVVFALLEKLPEQSPFEQKSRPSLGRPRKNRVNKNHSEINGLNKNGLNLDVRDVKIDDGSVKTNDSRPKINVPFYTQTTHTNQTYTEVACSAGESENAAASGYATATPTHAPSSSQDNPTLENTDYQPEPAIPGHDPHAPHLAENCKSWRLLFGGLDVATCQQYQAAIDTQREQRASSQAHENDNQSRIASDTPTTEDEQDGRNRAMDGDNRTSGHSSGDATNTGVASATDSPTGEARRNERGTADAAPTNRVPAGQHSQAGASAIGDANDLAAARPSRASAGNRSDVGGEQDGTALGAKMDVSGQAAGGYEKPAEQTNDAPTGKGTRTRTNRQASKPEPIEFSVNGRKVYDAWCANFKSPPRAGEKTVDCANDLYDRLVPWCQELHLSCKDLLKEIKSFLFATDTNGFYKRGVTLCDVDRDFEKWQSAKTEELEKLQRQAQKPQKEPTAIELQRALQKRYAPTGGALHA
jgi:hypothetical protein